MFFFPRPQDLILPNGTPVDTSSPASSSSLLNRLQLDDDLDGETRDLFVTVDDPKKHVSTMETYITYRVCTKVRGQSSQTGHCSTAARCSYYLTNYINSFQYFSTNM